MNQHRTHSAGFTLIELMVSIAIALLLILGVNEVFRISSETAGQGQTLSTISRDDRAIQNTLTEDMRNIVPVASASSPTADGPCFIIDSRFVTAFRNARDKAGAADPNNPLHDPTVFKKSVPPDYWNPVLINYRSHRVDQLSFFARGLFPRQTASPGFGYASPSTTSEAYIWYGHARLPNPSNAYFDPGDSNVANTSNQVASDFFLCRQAILLDPNIALREPKYLLAAPGPRPLAPLGFGSPSNDTTSPFGGTYVVQDSRYDVGASSISIFNQVLAPYALANPSGWWLPLLYRFDVDPFLTTPTGSTAPKVNSASTAMASPCLVRGCSQFIVEFAGNFYTKSPSGSMAHPWVDSTGQLDFYVDVDAAGNPLPNGNRHIRWYGFPRDTNGDGVIDARDVMPLRDVMQIGNDVEVANFAAPAPPYSGQTPNVMDYKGAFVWPIGVNTAYTAAWGPNSKLPFPKMIRITVAIDDPNGRLGDAQVFEYVFDVQQ
ncbi:MAG: hypothetical protein JWN24_3680 [Phycisphaerales bacterium]|nr:hypothetical protein [Phycisphaerales bacterium]